ncbi:restriction endonuclease subunit S [uncultured Haemophilus sp.]|uniref:restriction endonuclease subunit S n=1 Tax=uncultured Haemophilus sp. TaxID=237779 RepID=UPI002590BFD8|nr:restriction endonuclease subunit S [uncultured Haemophilus sp.]
MRRYESYKDSGVEWLGEVPHCWDVKKVKNIFHLIVEPAAKNNQCELLSVYTDIGVKPRAELEERGNKASTTDGYWIVKKGDIVVNKLLAWMGAIGLSEYDGVTSPAYDILRPHQQINGKFFHYLFRTPLCLSEFKKNSRGIMDMRLRLYFEELGNIYIPFPSYQEQQKIAQFLDDKTAKIDQAVDLAEKQIALLKEHKQILIQNAVTRGLNPDVPLKDSGVEWIGQVPEHWEVKKLKNIAVIFNGATPSSNNQDYWDGNIVWITPKDINNIKIITSSERKITQKGYENCGSYLVSPGNIVITTRAPIGKVAITDVELCTNQGCKSLVLNEKINNVFLYYYLIVSTEYLNSLGSGTTFMELSGTALGIVKVPLPAIQEQQKIADYLDKQTAKIDQAIALKTAHIEKLREYKSVLINDVVTGKVQVLV